AEDGIRVFHVTEVQTCALPISVFAHFTRDLPDYQQLASYDPPMVTRVQAGDGRLLAEFAVENRVFVPISAIPKRVIRAFLSAEEIGRASCRERGEVPVAHGGEE